MKKLKSHLQPPVMVEVEAFLPALRIFLAKRKEVVAAYLFGSYATGQQTLESDLDIALLLKGNKNKKQLYQLKLFFLGELTRIFREEEINLLLLNEAPPALKFGVLQQSKLLYCADENERVVFEIKSWQEYWDVIRLHDEYDRFFMEKFKRGDFGFGPQKGVGKIRTA